MFHDFVNLLFPTYCLVCPTTLVRGEILICTDCLYDLPQTDHHRVYDNAVARKFLGRLPVRYAMAMYLFQPLGKVQHLLHSLKYQHKPIIGKLFGRRYGGLLKEACLDKVFDIIVPVPLHPSRLQQRGYNQSDFFAQGLSETLQIPWQPQCIERNKGIATQTKKRKLDRFMSLENVFRVVDTTSIGHKHVLLVDDIITTGATIESCGTALLEAGIKDLSMAAIALVG